MILTVNSEKKEVAEGTTLAKLLEEIGVMPDRTVVELCGEIITRDLHPSTILKDGDTLELVRFVGGG